jgi:ethanolamine utilization protein EutQ (cupin superfamily)
MAKLIGSPTAIQSVGSLPKFAHEYVGLENTGNSKVSITLVHSPAGWTGVGQYADYHEYRVIYKGTLHVEHADGEIDVEAGQGLDVAAGEWVRFSTPGDADYVTVCLPAFTRSSVHRDK